jgi:hypothetical protein
LLVSLEVAFSSAPIMPQKNSVGLAMLLKMNTPLAPPVRGSIML